MTHLGEMFYLLMNYKPPLIPPALFDNARLLHTSRGKELAYITRRREKLKRQRSLTQQINTLRLMALVPIVWQERRSPIGPRRRRTTSL